MVQYICKDLSASRTKSSFRLFLSSSSYHLPGDSSSSTESEEEKEEVKPNRPPFKRTESTGSRENKKAEDKVSLWSGKFPHSPKIALNFQRG